MANIFDTKFDVPARVHDITPIWRDYVGPTTGAAFAAGEVTSKVEAAGAVNAKPIGDVLSRSVDEAIAKLRASSPVGTQFFSGSFSTTDAIAVQWGAEAPAGAETGAPGIRVALPPITNGLSLEYVQLVVSDMPQSHPCLVASPDASCRGDDGELDVGVRFVNEDGTSSASQRLKVFGSLRPYLRSNIVGAYPFQQGGHAAFWLATNEPVFDTVVIPVRDIKLADAQPFPFNATTRLAFDFDGTPGGTIGIRNIRLLGAAGPTPVVSQQR